MTKSIIEAFTVALMSGTFVPDKTQLSDFLKKSDPDFPANVDGGYPVRWVKADDGALEAYYIALEERPAGPWKDSHPPTLLNRLSHEASVVAAFIMTNRSLMTWIDWAHGKEYKPVAAFARKAYPFYEEAISFISAHESLLEAAERVEIAITVSYWKNWPHADLAAAAAGDEHEVAAITSLPLELRVEAYAWLSLRDGKSFQQASELMHAVLPELLKSDIFFSRMVPRPVSFHGITELKANVLKRTELLNEYLQPVLNPEMDITEWALFPLSKPYSQETREDARQRALKFPNDFVDERIAAHIPTYPTSRPSLDDVVALTRWAIYASRHPEMHAELEDVYEDIPRAGRILIMRTSHEYRNEMSHILLRTVAKEKLKAQSNK